MQIDVQIRSDSCARLTVTSNAQQGASVLRLKVPKGTRAHDIVHLQAFAQGIAALIGDQPLTLRGRFNISGQYIRLYHVQGWKRRRRVGGRSFRYDSETHTAHEIDEAETRTP